MCPIWNIPTIIVACKLAAIHGADVPLYEQGNVDAGDIRYLWFLRGLLRARLFHSTLRRLKFLIAVPETGFAVTAWGVAVWSPPSPPSTSLNCMQRETLAIAPRSERHVCGFFATAVSARAFKARLPSLRQKIPFLARVWRPVRSLRREHAVWSR
jgi:hypothetical protein